MMKLKILALLGFVLLATGISDNKSAEQLKTEKIAAEIRVSKAKQVAKTWFNSLRHGNTAVTTSLSAVPFEMGRRQAIKTIVELELIFENVKEKNGKRKQPITAMNVISDQEEIKKHKFPEGNIVIQIMVGKKTDASVLLCVKPGEQYKVIGLSD